MIEPEDFLRELKRNGIKRFFGVPDSILKGFLATLDNHSFEGQNVICANEGLAVSTAIGFHIADGSIPLVYMQNSGLGNAINPLTSISARSTYAVPLVLLIGWRGEVDRDQNQDDEPQHLLAGRATLPILEAIEIPVQVIDPMNAADQIKDAVSLSAERSSPVALLARKNTFAQSRRVIRSTSENVVFSREKAIQMVLSKASEGDVIVATTGFTSREVYENRKLTKAQYFLNVGGMGHALSISYGIASSLKDRRVWCLDGDGALIMHLGALVSIRDAPNIRHVVINNGVHESVGGQERPGRELSLREIASSCGVPRTKRCQSEDDFARELEICKQSSQCTFVEVMVERGFRSDLGRPFEGLISLKSQLENSIRRP